MYFRRLGFRVGAGSYHWANTTNWPTVDGRKQIQQLTCYRPHCDASYFDFVIFMIVHFCTWVVIAVPKGSDVPVNSDKDFEIWHNGLSLDDQQEVDDFIERFRIKAPAEMNRRKDNHEPKITDVDVHIFRLDPGGFLVFNAHKLYHATITPYQDELNFRKFLALHVLMWQSST